MAIDIKHSSTCDYACIALGEVMLRLDPGEGRSHTARQFTAWEGGGEYNVARGLRRCFGLKTGVVTAFADNPVGRLVEDFILQGGVDTQFIQWVDYDGIGRSVRNGLNLPSVDLGFVVLSAVRIVAIQRRVSSSPATSTGKKFLASTECNGFTPVAFMRHSVPAPPM